MKAFPLHCKRLDLRVARDDLEMRSRLQVSGTIVKVDYSSSLRGKKS